MQRQLTGMTVTGAIDTAVPASTPVAVPLAPPAPGADTAARTWLQHVNLLNLVAPFEAAGGRNRAGIGVCSLHGITMHESHLPDRRLR